MVRPSAHWRRYVSIAISLLLVVGIFAFAIPRIASYGAVIDIFRQLTWRELWSLLLATGFNLFTYWLANMAALPGLRLAQAAVITQTTTTVANTLPAGGAVAVGLTYEMLHSWGFNRVESTLYIVVTGIWNIFMKLALPVASVAILAITGTSSAAFVTAALLGLLFLAVAVVLFALILWREELARRLGDLGERVVSSIVNVFHRPRVTGLAESAVRFRRETIDLIRRRWWWLTGATILGHLALFLVLLLSLRHVGVSEAEISTAQALAVFAFGRLDLCASDHAWRTRCDRARIHRRPRRRRWASPPGRGGGFPVPRPHVRDPDPPRRYHVPDLAQQEKLAPSRRACPCRGSPRRELTETSDSTTNPAMRHVGTLRG